MRLGISSCLLTAAATLSFAPPAAAHGGIPRVVGIHFSPADERSIVLRSDAWGLFRSEDGGATWSWICAEAYAGDSLGVQHPSVAVLGDGSVMVANFFAGLRRSTENACGWSAVTEFADAAVTDVYRATDGTLFTLTTKTAPGSSGRLWRSVDGAAFEPVADQALSDLVPRSIAVAPGNSNRIYVAGHTAAGDVVLRRSSDGGNTWTSITLERRTTAVPRVSTLHEDANVVFLRLDLVAASQNDPDPADELLVSADGGDTFLTVFQAHQDLPGLTLSPDGQAVAIAGPADGLHVARLGDLLAEGEAAFEQVRETPLWALDWRQEGLYAGHDDFAMDGPRFSFGVSHDGGRTFEPLFSVCDVTLPECGDDSDSTRKCMDVFERLGGFRSAILESPRCAATAPDAGPAEPPPKSSNGGCRCALEDRSTAPPRSLWPLLLSALLVRARRARTLDLKLRSP